MTTKYTRICGLVVTTMNAEKFIGRCLVCISENKSVPVLRPVLRFWVRFCSFSEGDCSDLAF